MIRRTMKVNNGKLEIGYKYYLVVTAQMLEFVLINKDLNLFDGVLEQWKN